MTAKDLADPAYWARQLRNAVRFSDAIELVLKDALGLLLEVGPGRALSQIAQQHSAKSGEVTVFSTLDSSHEQTGEQALMLTTLGKLWLGGVKPDWDGFYANEKRRRIPLPTYPFERKRHWVEPISPRVSATAIPAAMPAADPDASPGQLEEIIQQQLRLMNDQLALIQANEGSQSSL